MKRELGSLSPLVLILILLLLFLLLGGGMIG